MPHADRAADLVRLLEPVDRILRCRPVGQQRYVQSAQHLARELRAVSREFGVDRLREYLSR